VEVEVLRVFLGEDGTGGNPLGVVLEGSSVPEDERQAFAARLGYSETVFVDDAREGRIRIFTPAAELPFAGHPTVGTAWLLADRGMDVDVLRPPAGDMPTWSDDGFRWVRARASWVHAIDLVELESPEAVDALTGPPDGAASWYPWAWEDREAGRFRSRYFVLELGIAEDEATGAAAVLISDRLGRGLEIRQGSEGRSRIKTRIGPDGTIDLGGRVRHEALRTMEVS
jgi:predicted PhzF superfamily epimerase YddE/YHI9